MNFKIWGIHSHLMEVEIEEMDQEVENKGQLATGSQEILITLSGICNSSLSTSTCIFFKCYNEHVHILASVMVGLWDSTGYSLNLMHCSRDENRRNYFVVAKLLPL